MAVKKAKKENELVLEEATVQNDIDTEIDEVEEVTETEVETPEVEVETDSEVETNVEVEVEEPTTADDVEVTVEDTVVDNTKKPLGNVKIRMRVDHRCCIAMERYDLKAGKVYTVPANVKTILNKAGLLSPI